MRQPLVQQKCRFASFVSRPAAGFSRFLPGRRAGLWPADRGRRCRCGRGCLQPADDLLYFHAFHQAADALGVARAAAHEAAVLHHAPVNIQFNGAGAHAVGLICVMHLGLDPFLSNSKVVQLCAVPSSPSALGYKASRLQPQLPHSFCAWQSACLSSLRLLWPSKKRCAGPAMSA